MAAVSTLAADYDVQDALLSARLAVATEMLGAAASAESAAAIGAAFLALTEAPRAAVFFRSPTGIVTSPWSHNLSDAYIRRVITPAGVNPWLHIMLHPDLKPMDLPKGRTRPPEPSLVRDIHDWPAASAALIERADREGLCSICSWPLSRKGRVIGAVACYYDTPHVCSEPEQAILRAFVARAATVVDTGVGPPAPMRSTDAA